MVHYSRKPQVSAKTAKAKISDLRCHFKNTFETANVINGMPLRKAQQLYRQVLAKTRCIPFKRYNGKIGRTAQAKEWGQTKGRWPRKSVVAMLSLLKNAEANAVERGLDPNKMVIKHVQVDEAARTRRRTFRAHGRISPFMCSPCHVQLFMTEPQSRIPVPKSQPKKKGQYTWDHFDKEDMEDIPFPPFERPRIVVRERPVFEENAGDVQLHVKMDADKLIAFAPHAEEGLMYECDQFFPSTTTQDEVYQATGLEAVDLVIQGFSSNVIVFGFAETGKTHTMYGNADVTGLIHDTVAELYRRLEDQRPDYRAKIAMRYWEMDRDLVEDALREPVDASKAEDSIKYAVFRDSLNRLTIPNLTVLDVPRMQDFVENLNRGSLRRIRRSYERMARWHGFVQLTITTTDRATCSRVIVRTLTFVHMKGNDCLGAKGIRGDQLREGSRINVAVTLLGSAVIHSLEYREKRKIQTATREGHHALIRRSQSFFLECKFSRVMSQFICGHEASFIVGCVSPLEYRGSIDTLEALQLFRRLKCALIPNVVVSARGRLLMKIQRQEDLIGGAAAAAELYASEGGPPLTEAEEKLLLLYGMAYGQAPKRLTSTSLDSERESAMLERSQSRACPRPGEVRTHGTRKRVFLNPSHSAWYEGQWENGKFGGLGLLVQKHSRYRGEFRDGLRDGEGTLWTREDEHSPWVRVYQGGWLAGKRDGFGAAWDANGDVYSGEWSGDKRQGIGKLFFANGDIVRGEFRDGLCDGRALLLTADGEWHDGYWAAGLREGPGLWCYVARQQYLRGEWVKGICRCGDLYDMNEKVTSEPSGFIPRLGLLHQAEVLEMERQKIRELRAMDFAAEGRRWEDPVHISPPLGALAEAIDVEEFGRRPKAETKVISVPAVSDIPTKFDGDLSVE